jgi:hypothetical protein
VRGKKKRNYSLFPTTRQKLQQQLNNFNPLLYIEYIYKKRTKPFARKTRNPYLTVEIW